MLSARQLRSVTNLLSDPGSAANAAGILAREARERVCLVSDLIASTLAPAPSATPPPPEPAAPPTAPCWRDIEPIDDGGPYAKRIDAQHVGLVGVVVAETDKAWRVETPNAAPAWLPKSQCANHGEDWCGRAVLVVPNWLAAKIKIGGSMTDAEFTIDPAVVRHMDA
jgi:hypothetical protein